MGQHIDQLSQPYQGSPVRVLIIPGVNDSGPAHWQTWLASQYKGARRVVQSNWDKPDLDTWSAQIDKIMDKSVPGTVWIAAAHSFGCLALAHHLDRHLGRPSRNGRIVAALMVAPADPVKFDVLHWLPQSGLGIPLTVIGSENDPWMPLQRAQEWASLGGARFSNLGAVGHINTESGFGPWPLARFKVDELIRDQQKQRRIDRAHPLELNYAI